MERTDPPKPGIYYDVPFEEYAAWDAFHQSMIGALLKSPLHMREQEDNPKEPTVPMIRGSALDCLLSRPGDYWKEFADAPATYTKQITKGRGDKKVTVGVECAWNLNSHTCQAVKADWEARGVTLLTYSESLKVRAMQKNVLAHPEAAKIIANSRKQVAVVWIDCTYRITCKGVLDFLEDGAITDLKCTVNASLAGFPRQMDTFGVHTQGAMYSDGVRELNGGLQLPVNIIAAENEAPYAVAVYNIGEDSLLAGRFIYKRAMQRYKDCLESGEWPGYSQFIEPIDIPAYSLKREISDESINEW